ncbi:hypothetical protein [Phocaeicola plebeius]|uniref:hypothetical protein n=1 Tax=Phocaeicola plebeius TaxID=310297 RepID=UPI003078FD31
MQAVAELVQFLGGGQYLHGLLAAKSPGDAFLFLRHGAYTGGTFRHFGQMVHQKAVCLVLTGESFHKVQQVGFFFHQEGAERVYLCRTHEILAAGLHGLQQAVRPQPPDAVVTIVRLFPADDAFAQCGEGGDAALGDGDVTPYLLYFARFGFYLTHPSTFMHQNGGHATDDRHQDQIPGKDFRL